MKPISPDDFKAPWAPAHGSPEDRGSADRYYGRRFRPHKRTPGPGNDWARFIETEDLTPDEIEAYRRGWENEDDRKDWR